MVVRTVKALHTENILLDLVKIEPKLDYNQSFRSDLTSNGTSFGDESIAKM